MKQNKLLPGHVAAAFTILVWGTTYISTKVLLSEFSPIAILFIRFLIGYLALWAVCPRRFSLSDWKQERYYMAAGLCGITLYYLFENIALTYTMASHVGVIISIAPFFTALFDCLFLHGKRPAGRFYLGLVIAILGVSLISFNSVDALTVNPIGDLLAVIAAVIWAGYSTLTKKISTFGCNTIQTTRRTFFYGLIFMLPVLPVMDFQVSLSQFKSPVVLLNLLFLGLFASAVCFVTWNVAVRLLGSVRTSVYIYAVPVITAVTSVLILHEHITWIAVCGIILTITGLFLSNS